MLLRPGLFSTIHRNQSAQIGASKRRLECLNLPYSSTPFTASQPWFDPLVTAAIVANAFLLASYDPMDPTCSKLLCQVQSDLNRMLL